jgi:hypothetical protein
VRTTLELILERLKGPEGEPPKPEQILDLKVCDPAMGSGAFLVETCRELADALIESWGYHGFKPAVPLDEDDVIFARRLVAQRCLYGVDKNPVAVDLAKMSLWLVTLARDHALTFVDHALRHGDSLVGLTLRQIEAFHWDPTAQGWEAVWIRKTLERVAELRELIRDASENISDEELCELWDEAQRELIQVRLYGDLVLTAFFEADTLKERNARRHAYAGLVTTGEAETQRSRREEWSRRDLPLVPFHWEVEFPEVFARANPGFDTFVGNPPFMGGKRISTSLGESYRDWLAELNEESSSNADLVAHFFRRAFSLLREGGAFGLIATNTIAQGETRASGLRWICKHDGQIFVARSRLRWPGLAAVVVSVVHVAKGEFLGQRYLDGDKCDRISAFLFHRGGDEDPVLLGANSEKSFIGHFVHGGTPRV